MSVATVANWRILVIDDNRAIHNDFIKILGDVRTGEDDLDRAEALLFGEEVQRVAPARFEIDSAYQGQEGLELVRRASEEARPYSLAFVDVRMPPGWDGVQTAKKLWEIEPDLQVVICTAYSDYSWNGMIRELGVSDKLLVLRKPFDTVEVFQLAHALTEKWRLLQVSKRQLEGLGHLVDERTRELQTANDQLRKEVQVRAATEDALRTTQARLEHLLTHSPVVIYSEAVKENELIPSWVSENIHQMLGWSTEEWRRPGWMGHHLEPEDSEVIAGSLTRLFAEGTSRAEFRLRHEDGRILWIQDERKLMRDVSGTPVQVVGAWTDITERRLLEERLRDSQKMEAIGRLAGGVAHDFNNLLSVIDGYTDILLGDDRLDPEMTDSIREIAGAAKRAGTLTRQLLAYGRQQILDAQAVDLSEVVCSFGRMYQRILREGIELKIEPADEPAIVAVDRPMIEQVLLNLVVNARDAMPQGGTLVISVVPAVITEDDLAAHQQARIGSFVCVRVADSGWGIAPDVGERMFEPFFTTKDVGKGTGLGLAMVYGIVQQHRGWIEVDSEMGQGSVFSVFLPAAKSAGSQIGERQSRSSEVPSGNVSHPGGV